MTLYFCRPLYLFVVFIILVSFATQFRFLSTTIISSSDSLESQHASFEYVYKKQRDIVANTSSNRIPQWMKDYFEFHSRKLDDIKRSKHNIHWTKQRLLIIRCISEDRCGGTSDRLKSIPLFLAIAAKTKRLLFLRWNRPFPLETFLIPGPFLNWTVPDTLQTFLTNGTAENEQKADSIYFDGLKVGKLVAAAENTNHWLVEGNVHVSGSNLYRKLARQLQSQDSAISSQQDDNALEYTTFYHDLFPGLFVPSPPIRNLVAQLLQQSQLKPNQYVVAHYRSKYPGEPYRESKNLTILQQFVNNAIDCAASLSPSLPVYFASDAVASLQAAEGLLITEAGILNDTSVPSPRVVTHLELISTQEDPPHLNFAIKDHPSAFYSIFVDLIVMSQSRCVSFGAGGFGRFGSLISFNATCRIPHSKQGKIQSCPTPK